MLRAAVARPMGAVPMRRLARVTRCFARAGHTPPVIGRNIETEIKGVAVGPRTLQIVFPNLDQVMDHYIASGQEHRDPYWCDVWPSALAAAAELAELDLAGRTLVDIGCGLGTVGIAAALQGCSRVCLLDQEPLALQCAALAASLNGLQVVAPEAVGTATLSLGPRVDDGPRSVCPGAPALELLPFDWTLDDPRPLAADVVVASDVLYEARFVEPLARTLPQLLRSEESQLVLVDPLARTPAHRAALLERLTRKGPDALVLRERRLRASSPASEPDIQVLILQKRQPGDTLGIKL